MLGAVTYNPSLTQHRQGLFSQKGFPHHKVFVEEGDLSLSARVGARGLGEYRALVRHLRRHRGGGLVEVLHGDALAIRVQEEHVQDPRNLRHRARV